MKHLIQLHTIVCLNAQASIVVRSHEGELENA
jgi:hypothetical protein